MTYRSEQETVRFESELPTRARDNEGHGSHTLSTAGGSFVPGASVFGFGNGAASGGSPKARVAAYKVCWPNLIPFGGGCFDADVMAAFEAAISDGVDVLSVSLGSEARDYFEDVIAIGSFHAVANGIVVVASAGNSGPFPESVSNVWTMDANNFASYVTLGDKKIIKGGSLSEYGLSSDKAYPLISSVDAKYFNGSISEAMEVLILRRIHIIAAYTEAVSATGLESDTRITPFFSMTGTSMSCPHVAGLAGLLKALHPDWSPAAIKQLHLTMAGHIKPNSAVDPGLVYDLNITDFLNYFSQLKMFDHKPYTCPESFSLADFNYPTITISEFGPGNSVNVSRTVTNIGSGSTYTVRIKAPPHVEVWVEPRKLRFKKKGEKKEFRVALTLKKKTESTTDFVFGWLTWTNKKHHVRSSIAVNMTQSIHGVCWIRSNDVIGLPVPR
ncbi:hypothetical protein V8G54_016874 [Vigna mungo]|uniref:Uncharacterized protein n=1 Tax=Vigna mungo TaxID=3915 RepID=A0AAQ3NL28_VIGMU